MSTAGWGGGERGRGTGRSVGRRNILMLRIMWWQRKPESQLLVF